MENKDLKLKGRRKPRKDDEEIEVDEFRQLSLSRINGEINRMKKDDMMKLLKQNNLHTKGVKEVLGRRLKNYYRKQRLQIHTEYSGHQLYNHFLVIDFEATCEAGRNPDYLHEIIEFPAVLVNAEDGKIVEEFHSYCRPSHNPVLSEFCVSLTGITQPDVDAAAPFYMVFKDFEKWMLERNLLTRHVCALVSDGPWDFSRFLNVQCCLSGIKFPRWARKWINLKKVYGNFYKLKKPKIEEMLSNLGLKFEGRLHCGLDDARNLSRIVSRLIDDGCILQVNEALNAGNVVSITETERKLMAPGAGASEEAKEDIPAELKPSDSSCSVTCTGAAGATGGKMYSATNVNDFNDKFEKCSLG